MTASRWQAGRAALALILSAALAACSVDVFTYSLDRYGTVRAVNVSLGCRDTYEVFDRPDAGTLIVVTNVFNEALVGCLDGGLPDLASRQRQVARFFFEERSNRPLCRITGESQLAPHYREFSYTCPVVPEAARPAKGRPRRS